MTRTPVEPLASAKDCIADGESSRLDAGLWRDCRQPYADSMSTIAWARGSARLGRSRSFDSAVISQARSGDPMFRN